MDKQGDGPAGVRARPVAGSLIEDKRDGSGLLFRRNRYMDPATGRFTQEDPIGLAGGLNLYGFASGDPVNFSDPFGLCPPKTRADMPPTTGPRHPDGRRYGLDFGVCSVQTCLPQ